jgi:PAS domain S-box-containing protein
MESGKGEGVRMKAAGVSFRTMLLAMIAAVVVPLAALLPLGVHQAFESRSELAREGVRHLASTAAVAIDQAFADMRRSLEAAARRYDPDSATAADCAAFIATVKALQPNAANVAYGDRRGAISCSVAPLPAGGLDLKRFPEFRKPIAEGVTMIGEPMVSPITGLAQVLLATPVRDRSGQIAGVLAMAVRLDVVRRLATGAVGVGRATLSVIAPSGVMIAHAPEGGGDWVGRSVADLPVGRAILDPAATPGELISLDGTEQLAGVARVASTGWSVVAALPKQQTLAPVYSGVWLSLGFAACVILAAAALAALVARRLSRPVEGVVSAMQLASAGAPDARAPESGPREIALIGAEFNRMIAAQTRLEAERRAAERRLREVIETLGEALAIIGADGRYELVNRAEEELVGVPRDRLVGMRFDEVPWKRASAEGVALGIPEHPFERLRRGEPPLRNYEVQLVPPAGQPRTALANAAPLHDAAGNFDGIVLTAVDITERRAAERRLREVIEMLAEGLVIIGADGRYELVNRAEEELLGTPRERMLGVRFDAAPFGRATADGAAFRIEDHPFERLRRGEAPMRGYEFQLVQPGGQARTVVANAAPLRDAAGNFDGVVATCVDITERKAAEARIAEYSARLAALSRRVFTVQEEERRAVARELHDELGQVLTAVRLNLQTLRRRSRDPELRPVFEDGLALLETAIAEVRALSTRLRPTILDDLGLEAALRSHLERSRARAELELDTDITLPHKRLDPAVETACFRIVQEAMTNVVRHAGAHRLAVALRAVDGELVLSVRDDGHGFDPAAAAQRAARGESAGLSGMEERAQLAGGRLEIDAAPGRGTEVRAVFPLAEAAG